MRLVALLLATAWTMVPVSGLALSLTFRTIAADGDQAVGAIGTLRLPSLNAGAIASISEDGLVAVVAFTTTSEQGVWVFDPSGTATLIVKKGDPVPGQPGAIFNFFEHGSSIAEGGAFAFYGSVLPAPLQASTSGLWRVENGATFSPVFEEGDLAPGTQDAFFRAGQRLFDSDAEGRVVFREELTGNQVDQTNDLGIWLRQSDGTVVLLAREGTAVPAISASPVLRVGHPVMNAGGESTFSLATGQDDGTVRASSGGQLSWVVRAGDVAVGTGGARFDRSLGGVIIGDSGSVVYSATLDLGTTDPSIDIGTWIFDRSGVSRLLLREGDPVPDLPGVTFGGTLHGAAINESDQVVGATTLAGLAVTALNDNAISRVDPSGDITLLAREGDTIPGATSITFVDFFFNLHINARGDVAFSANVHDSTTGRGGEAIFFRSWDGVLLTVARPGDVIEFRPGVFGTIDDRGDPSVSLLGLTDDREILFGAMFGQAGSALFVVQVPEPSIVLMASISALLATRNATRRGRS